MSTPKSSKGKWRGKSTKEKRVWSGKAKTKGGKILGSRISISTLVRPGTGTGALNSLRIQVSISRTSWRTIDGTPSKGLPVRTDQTVSL